MRTGARSQTLTGDGRVRAFFALAVVEPQRAVLVQEIERLRKEAWARDVRWVHDQGLHLTLRFLGDMERTDIDSLAGRVGDEISCLPAFETALQSVELFPSPRRPHVVAAVLVESESLRELARRVEQGVVAHGLDAEPRAFRGHITLGRFRGRPSRRAALSVELSPTRVRVDCVILYRSVLSREGSRYSELARLQLAESAVD